MPRTVTPASPPRRKRGTRARLKRDPSSRVSIDALEFDRLLRRSRRWPDRRGELANPTAVRMAALEHAENDEHLARTAAWSGAIGYDRPIVLGFVLTAALVALAVGSGAR
jgi:hypothetical protein